MTTPVPDEGCEVWEIGCRTSDALAGVAGDALAALAKAVGDAVGSVLVDLSTVWVDVGTPNLTTSGNNPSDAVAFIQGSLWWYMAAAAVLSVTVGGARMAWERRAEPGLDVLRSLMTLTVVSGAGLAAIALAVQAADAFAVWIIDRSTVGTSFGENLGALLLAPLVTPTAVGDGMPALLVIFLGVGGIVTSCVQIVLMIVRSGMLVILAGSSRCRRPSPPPRPAGPGSGAAARGCWPSSSTSRPQRSSTPPRSACPGRTCSATTRAAAC
jgi:hypothetical protein